MFQKIIGYFFIFLGTLVLIAVTIVLGVVLYRGGAEKFAHVFVVYMFTFFPAMGLFYYFGFKLKNKVIDKN